MPHLQALSSAGPQWGQSLANSVFSGVAGDPWASWSSESSVAVPIVFLSSLAD